MNPEERRSLLSDLRRGRTSRNRDLDRFAEPESRRVLTGYRRVKALWSDLSRPGVGARARWVENPGHLAVAVEDPRLRYRRVVLLTPWEAEFLAALGGPGPEIALLRGR
jgi:hypothetical protein